MDKLLKWEQKRITAMLLAGVMLFNAVTGIEMQSVYAAEDVVEEADVTMSADAGGTTDGSEGDDAGSATDGDVSGDSENVTDGDVSGGSGNVTDGDVSGDISGEVVIVTASDVTVGDYNAVVIGEYVNASENPVIDNVKISYKIEGGMKKIFVTGEVSCRYDINKVAWSNVSQKSLYDYNLSINLADLRKDGNVYHFSFNGELSGNQDRIFICAQSSQVTYSEKDYYITDEEEGIGAEDRNGPTIDRVELTTPIELYRNTEFCNYFRSGADIKLSVTSTFDNAGVKNYEIRSGGDIDNLAFVKSSEDGSFQINELSSETKLWIRAEDNLGNWSDARLLKEVVKAYGGYDEEEGCDIWNTYLTTSNFMIDESAPGITFQFGDGEYNTISSGVNFGWHSDWTNVRYLVAERESRLEHVVWNFSGASSSALIVNSETDRITEYSDAIPLINGINTITISAGDYAGNEVGYKFTVGIDREPPEITGCSLAPEEDSMLNMFSFGNFANGNVKLTVNAMDPVIDGEECAGVEKIELYVGGVLKQTLNADNDSKAEFTIPISYFSEKKKELIEVRAIDRSGLVSRRVAINEFATKGTDSATVGGILSSEMLIETENPDALLEMNRALVNIASTRKVVGKAFEISVGGSDKHSGVNSYQVTYRDASGNMVSENQVPVIGEKEIMSVSQNVVVTADKLGNLTGDIINIEVTAHDNAGNSSNPKTQEFFIDSKAPEAKKFVIIGGGKTEEAEIISSGDYGYFFNEEVEVRLYFDDGVVGETSGVKTITCYTIDSEGKRVDREVSAVKSESAGNTSAKTIDQDASDGDVSDGDASDGNAPDEDEDSPHNYYYATITIEDGFKGHIYASATDYADNAMVSYASTKGVVVETMSRHETEQHVVIDLPKSPAKDDEGNNLYAENVTIPVTIIDTMSGVNSIWWEVKAPHDTNQNYTGSISIGDIIEDVSENGTNSEWTIEGERNLVYKVKKDFVVSNNSNGIEISIYMMDNAGNVIKEDENGKATISIDKTKPTIEISFDNNNPDDVYTNIYSEDRTATITVKERNFSSDKISVDITNAIGGTPSLSGWSSSKNTENPDESTHTATITFSEDGEYTMNVSGEDAVGNDADSKSIDPFILDKTLPKLEVTYSNNNVRNGNYYADARTVIVTVTERNFAPERIHLTGTVTDSGTTRSFPALSNFTQRGDVYTATALCQDDGLYSFTVEYSDKAGNQGQTYTAEAYHIDKTAPVISFAGVEPNSANNGDLMPQVIMTDDNFNKGGVNIQLFGANNGLVDLGGEFATLTNGQSFTYANFPKEAEYDDLYTIHVELSDLAGNVTDSDITFSVNRFGSVYVFDQSLKDIAGTYIKSPVDVNLTEINIDSLEHDTIKVVMDYNGTSRDLVEGDDYEVQQVRGEGSWYRYNYNINSSLFEGDGRYIVALYSVDRAGNINQNTDEVKQAEISFGVDKTAPMVIPIDLEENKQYAVDIKTATVTVNDNLLLKDVAIFVNGKECEYTNNGENYVFNIPNSKTKQQITVSATDMAGNVTEHIIGGVLVNTNLFIRWYNNRPLFVGTLLALAAMCGGGVIFLAVYRRRKYED